MKTTMSKIWKLLAFVAVTLGSPVAARAGFASTTLPPRLRLN